MSYEAEIKPPSGNEEYTLPRPRFDHLNNVNNNPKLTQVIPAASSPRSMDDPSSTGVAKHIDDFKFIKPISRGTYGKVFLGYRKDKPEVLYAIKAIKKEDLIRKNMVNSVHIERKAFCLSAADPFCVRLFYSLQTPKTVYLVMDYMIGGDLKSLLSIMGFFDLAAAAFYTAEISSALDFIHKCGVVHRDVKPDNVLIDARGHVKLTDFGLSRVSMESDLTPRRMNNFTPGQLMSLKTEFCFPTTSPDISKSFENKLQPEEIRGNENSVSIGCGMMTPICSQEYSSILNVSRRFRKPLRKLRNIENKAAVSLPSLNKLTPEMPKVDMKDWSIIQTPKERKTKCVEYGSYLDVTFDSPPDPVEQTEVDSPAVMFHHSSPIGPKVSKIPIPFFSPLLSMETPYSSDIYHYEPTENPSKRHRSGESFGEGKFNTAGGSMEAVVHLNPVGESIDDAQYQTASASQFGGSTRLDVSANTAANMLISPEMARRDHMQMTNYMNLIDNLNFTQAVPIKIPADTDHKPNISMGNASNKGSGSFKRKRWIHSSSRSRTGISMHMRRLAIGSAGSHHSVGSIEGSSKSSSGSNDKNISPPNASGGRIVGTPDYLAPEIIAKQAHGPAVDWWSLGVCLYEFVVGCLPFSGDSLNSIFHNIEIRDLEFPPDTDPSVQNCIEMLLDLDPEKRPDLARLRSSEFHGFFGNLPWDNMSLAQPPFVPTPTSPTDTGYFNPRNREQNLNVSEMINPQ